MKRESKRQIAQPKELTPELLAYDAGFTDGWNLCFEREFNASGGFNAPERPHKQFLALIRKHYKKWVKTGKSSGNLAASLSDSKMESAKYLVITSSDDPDEAVPAATFAIFPALENAENYKRDMKKANPRCDVAIFRYAA